jgi:hypothetical protein
MIEDVPAYVSIVFILTTFLTAGFLVYSIRRPDTESAPARIVLFALPFWMIFTAVLALGGFFQTVDSFPPRVFSVGVLPVLLFVLTYFVFFRKTFIERLNLKTLTLLHVVRVPVEIVLLCLFQSGVVPQIMTFEGRNLDILSGISAPLIYYLAFRGGKVHKGLLIVWHIAALGLLFNIVIIAALSIPSPMQRLGLDQPNVGVMYFPYIWLPAIVVTAVLFSHLAALWMLFKSNSSGLSDIKP